MTLWLCDSILKTISKHPSSLMSDSGDMSRVSRPGGWAQPLASSAVWDEKGFLTWTKPRGRVERGEGGGFTWGGVEGWGEKAYNCN